MKRFPSDFISPSTPDKVNRLRSQFAASKTGQGERYLHRDSMNWKRNTPTGLASRSKQRSPLSTMLATGIAGLLIDDVLLSNELQRAVHRSRSTYCRNQQYDRG